MGGRSIFKIAKLTAVKNVNLFQTIFDGATSDSPVLAKLCGHHLPTTTVYTSSGVQMLVTLTTDYESGFFKGYSADYAYILH